MAAPEGNRYGHVRGRIPEPHEGGHRALVEDLHFIPGGETVRQYCSYVYDLCVITSQSEHAYTALSHPLAICEVTLSGLPTEDPWMAIKAAYNDLAVTNSWRRAVPNENKYRDETNGTYSINPAILRERLWEIEQTWEVDLEESDEEEANDDEDEEMGQVDEALQQEAGDEEPDEEADGAEPVEEEADEEPDEEPVEEEDDEEPDEDEEDEEPILANAIGGMVAENGIIEVEEWDFAMDEALQQAEAELAMGDQDEELNAVQDAEDMDIDPEDIVDLFPSDDED